MTESRLVQTKNAFKVVGKVSRIDKDGAYKEEQMAKGKRQGDTYRSLRFGVKTSDTNEITVQMFDYEPEKLFMWNSEKKKADSSYKGDYIPFGQWEANPEMYREQGYAILQTRIGLTTGEDGKIQSQGLPSFVASSEIYNNLENGDSVVIEGEIRYSKYKPANSEKEVEQKTYTIKKAFKIKDLDFADAKFEEVTYFEQEMVFVDIDIDKKEGKAYVTGRIIDFMKNFHDTQMIINFMEDGKQIPEMVKLVSAIKDKVKFGDVINVFGDTLNRVVIEEVEDEGEEKDDPFAIFGGKQKPKHAQAFTSRTYITEMQILGLDGWEQKVYTEEDFIKDDLIEDNSVANEFGGKPKKANPFDLGETDEIDEEDLPF